MNKTRNIVSIDVGSSKISTLIAQSALDEATGNSKVNIIGVASTESRGVKKGQIVDIEEAVEACIESVEAAERMAGYSVDKTFVSIGGGHIMSQNSQGVVAVSDAEGEVNDDDVDRVIEAARAISLPSSRDIIHVLPREFIVDGETGIRDPIGMSGVRLEVDTHIVTASSPAMKNLEKTVKEVGVNIDEIVFAGLASTHATLTETEKELGCVLIDIGSGTTSVVAFVDGSIAFSGAIPIGAKNVTNDLAVGLRVSLDRAEEIKLELSKPPKQKEKRRHETIDVTETGSKETKKISKRTLTEGIIRPRLNEIFTMVKLDLEKAGIINKIPSGAIITGGGALTIGAKEIGKKALNLPTKIGTPGGVGGLIDDILDPRFATSIGLILYANEFDFTSSQKRSTFSLPKGIKLPSTGAFTKIADSIRDLLP